MNKPTIGYHVGILSRLYLKRINEKLIPTGITGSQWSILRLLSQGPLTQREICTNLSIEASSVSTMLHSLEAEGWVNRSSDEHDKREKRVALSTKASRNLEDWLQISEALSKEALSNIPAADAAVFERVLEQLIQNLRHDH